MQHVYNQTRAISNARAAHTVDDTRHVQPVRLADNTARATRRSASLANKSAEEIILGNGFTTVIEFMEACKSNNLLTSPDQENVRVRKCYSELQQYGLLSAFWAMFRAYRANKGKPVQDYTFEPPATWHAHNTTVILDKANRQIIVHNRIDLNTSKYVLNYSWEPVSKSSVDSQANFKRVLRIVANSGIRHAVEVAIMEGVQQ
jgi:hypothetical protein|nr:MAG TPA: hypothetical protein [Caudoviricetes sp.]